MQQRDIDTTLIHPPRPPRRRRSRAPIVLVLIALALGSGAAAVVNYQSGSGWQERARSQARRAGLAEARIDELEAEVDNTARLLERSEADVERLESRLDALATEKAGAEDTAALASEEAELATQTAEELADLTVLAAEVGGALRDCTSLNMEITSDLIEAYNGGSVDVDAFNARIETINQVCVDAEGQYNELVSRLNALDQ